MSASTSTPVRMPRLGESVVEGTVARWLKQPGEQVALLEPLLEISTDKIDTEIPSPAAGTLLEVLVSEGSTVATGTLLATIGNPAARAAASEQPAGAQASTIQATASETPDPETKVAQPGKSSARASTAQDDESQDETTGTQERPSGRGFISPVVQRIASEHQIDLTQVQGTGLSGRVTKQDMLAYIESMGATTEERTPAAPAPRHDTSREETSREETSPEETPTVEPLSAMRRAIAQHMVKSVQTSPHVATIFEVDMTNVVRHREANKQAYAQRGVNLTFTPYFVAAAARALRKHALVNSRYSDAGIIRNARIHIGVAVSLGTDGSNGLLVPVVRDADELTLAGLARTIEEMAGRARRGALQPDDVQGGTFTISNHGVGGSLIGTPIIAQPQSAILGVGAIVKRAVVRSGGKSLLPSSDDAIVIRPMCYLTLSFDHRILDGATADAFMRALQSHLEGWQQE